MIPYLRMFPLVAAMLAVPGVALAGPPEAACTVQIDYTVNGTVVETYANSFTLTRNGVFLDDISTPTREKLFRATLTRAGDGLTVFIDYFSDVSVFNAVNLNASVRLRDGKGLSTDAGSHTFSSSQAVPAGNHTTSHTLVCGRQ